MDISALSALFKLRLTLLVLISALMGYLMGCDTVETTKIMWLLVGGLLLTGGSNGLNQVLERDYDALMNRTKNRPIPSGRMSVLWATIISFSSGVTGVLLLWVFISATCGILGLFAFLSYVFLYTPMKRISSLAVFVGAFPGAIPPMLGYVAATDDFGLAPGLLFAAQFMWQFPHFWAIAWVSHEDYLRGGYKLLPFSEGPSKRNAFQIFLYSLFLIPVSLLPWALPLHAPMTGPFAAITTTVAGLIMAYFAQRLYTKGEMKSARAVMFTSFFYLPIVQLAYVLDRIA